MSGPNFDLASILLTIRPGGALTRASTLFRSLVKVSGTRKCDDRTFEFVVRSTTTGTTRVIALAPSMKVLTKEAMSTISRKATALPLCESVTSPPFASPVRLARTTVFFIMKSLITTTMTGEEKLVRVLVGARTLKIRSVVRVASVMTLVSIPF